MDYPVNGWFDGETEMFSFFRLNGCASDKELQGI